MVVSGDVFNIQPFISLSFLTSLHYLERIYKCNGRGINKSTSATT
jgi:hypothetical protein